MSAESSLKRNLGRVALFAGSSLSAAALVSGGTSPR